MSKRGVFIVGGSNRNYRLFYKEYYNNFSKVILSLFCLQARRSSLISEWDKDGGLEKLKGLWFCDHLFDRESGWIESLPFLDFA